MINTLLEQEWLNLIAWLKANNLTPEAVKTLVKPEPATDTPDPRQLKLNF